jgi:glycosyltransferase involved in cell wall biosynthesis
VTVAKQSTSKRLKIILVGTAYPFRGGIAHYLALLAKHLAKRHDVTTVTFSRQYPAFLFPGKTQEEQGGAGTSVPAAQLIDSINPFTWISTARTIAVMKPDLLIFKYWLPFFGPCFGTIACLVRRWTGARIVFICDNVIPHERRIGDIAFTRFAFQFVDLFIVQSHAVERELRQFRHGANAVFVPHPIYEIFGDAVSKARARKHLGISHRRVLLFFGYVRRYKGLDTLLEALAAVRADLDVHLLVVGEFYHDEQIYRKLIADLGIKKNVTVVSEYVPNDRVGEYFSAADVVVLPYRSATQSGIVQIAYQFDKPVIATDVGGLAEVVRHNVTGFIVPPENHAALSSAIIEYYKGKHETGFTRAVQKEKKRYSWETMARAIEEHGVKGYGPASSDKANGSPFRVRARTKE